MEEVNKSPLKRISTWGQFMGILTIVSGSISAIIGLFNFIIGAIPGVITIIIGYFIFRTGREAKFIADSDDFKVANLNELLDKYGKVLLISGILGIIFVILVLLSLLILLFFGVMSMNTAI